jgi:hypothetical protein
MLNRPLPWRTAVSTGFGVPCLQRDQPVMRRRRPLPRAQAIKPAVVISSRAPCRLKAAVPNRRF